MDLNIYNTVQQAVMTAKSQALFKKEGKLVFKVHRLANKIMIRRSIESLWDVKVEKVATITTRGRSRRFSGHKFVTSSYKKAVVTLRKGYTIDMPWQYESIQEESTAPSLNSDKR